MSESEITTGPSGVYLQNWIADNSGMKTIEPFGNGVIIQLIYRADEDGVERLTPFVSVMLKDEDMKAVVKEYAANVLRLLRS